MDPVWLAAIVPAVGAVTVGLMNLLTSRRTSGGRVATSEAGVIWEQTRAMLDGLRRDKERAEDQRDRLLDLQETQIMPSLEAIAKSQQHVLGILTELAGQMGLGGGE